MKFWFYIACCLLVVGVFCKHPKFAPAKKRDDVCCGVSADDEDDEGEEQPKRLVVYYNFESVSDSSPTKRRISDKSGYENSGTMSQGGEVLKFSDSDYTCNQGARLYNQDIIMRGDTFQAKPKQAITVAAWIRLEQKRGQHSVFDTIGTSHPQGQYHFEVNDGVLRWFHRNEQQKVIFETMAHTVETGKWQHVAGTYDSKTRQAKAYINGEIRNQSIGEGILSRDWSVRAGISNSAKSRPLRGSVDEFRIYNYALKPDEIKALVSACRTGNAVDATPNDQIPETSENAPGSSRSITDSKDTSTDTEEGGGGSKRAESDDKAVLKRKRSLLLRPSWSAEIKPTLSALVTEDK